MGGMGHKATLLTARYGPPNGAGLSVIEKGVHGPSFVSSGDVRPRHPVEVHDQEACVPDANVRYLWKVARPTANPS